jgi:SAM-dependent methyltransferase
LKSTKKQHCNCRTNAALLFRMRDHLNIRRCTVANGTEEMSAEKIFDPRQALANPGIYSRFQKSVRRDSSMMRLTELLRIQPGQRVLDIGCGPADILAYLPDGIDYFGYDLEERYIAYAKRRFGKRGSFEVRCVSPDAADENGKFDTVISIGVLHHLTDIQADAVFASALKLLQPGGRIVTCDGAYVKGQNPIARLLLALDRGRHVRPAGDYLTIARRHFPQATATILHDLLAIPYTHCIIEAFSPLSA